MREYVYFPCAVTVQRVQVEKKKNKAKEKTHKMQVRVFNSGSSSVGSEGFQTYQPAAGFSECCSLCAASLSTYSFLKALCDSGLAGAESYSRGRGSATVVLTSLQ